MANIKSQKKRIRTNEAARMRNKAVKSELKTLTKHVQSAVAEGDAEKAQAALKTVTKRLDMAAAKHVIHTVGPIVGQEVTDRQREDLRSCYLSCLKLAAKQGLKTIAFCCISTGEFHFPNKEAAQIALQTIDTCLSVLDLSRVVINVFKEEDFHIYKNLFEEQIVSWKI